MPSKKQERLQQIQAIVNQQQWPQVDPAAFGVLCERFPSVSPQTLRRDLRETSLEVHALVEGVRLCSLPTLRLSMLALHECHAQFPAEVRRLILDARRKAEHVIRNPRVNATKRRQMEEKLLWLRVWLENPALFPAWAALRERSLENAAGEGNLDGCDSHL